MQTTITTITGLLFGGRPGAGPLTYHGRARARLPAALRFMAKWWGGLAILLLRRQDAGQAGGLGFQGGAVGCGGRGQVVAAVAARIALDGTRPAL